MLTFYNGGTGTLFLNPFVHNFYMGLYKDTFHNIYLKKIAPESGGTFMSS